MKANSLWRTAITVGGTPGRFTHAIPPAPLAATLFWHVPRPRRYRELCRKRVNENDSGEVSPCLAESVKACEDRVPRLVVVGVPANLDAVQQSRDGDLGPDGPRELVAGPAELQRRWPGGLWPGPPAELPPQRAEPIGLSGSGGTRYSTSTGSARRPGKAPPWSSAVAGRVRVHRARGIAVQLRTRCSNSEPDLAAIGPEATGEGGVSDLSTLGIWVCARRSIAPRRARVQRLFGLQSCIGHF